MAATVDQLNAQLAALQASLTATLSVRHGEELVHYRPVDEIRGAIAAVEQQISAAGGQGIVRSFKLTSCKDL